MQMSKLCDVHFTPDMSLDELKKYGLSHIAYHYYPVFGRTNFIEDDEFCENIRHWIEAGYGMNHIKTCNDYSKPDNDDLFLILKDSRLLDLNCQKIHQKDRSLQTMKVCRLIFQFFTDELGKEIVLKSRGAYAPEFLSLGITRDSFPYKYFVKRRENDFETMRKDDKEKVHRNDSEFEAHRKKIQTLKPGYFNENEVVPSGEKINKGQSHPAVGKGISPTPVVEVVSSAEVDTPSTSTPGVEVVSGVDAQENCPPAVGEGAVVDTPATSTSVVVAALEKSPAVVGK